MKTPRIQARCPVTKMDLNFVTEEEAVAARK
jgi:hypothetical protein